MRKLKACLVVAALICVAASPAPEYKGACPETLNEQARMEELASYMIWFSQTHPHATNADYLQARYEMLVAHGCRQTLANLKENGQ